MKKLFDFLARNGAWFLLGLLALIALNPALPEINTLLIIAAIEALALALSGLAVFAYTRIDFTREMGSNPGFIFLGVHICTGLTVLGVYIAQFAA